MCAAGAVAFNSLFIDFRECVIRVVGAQDAWLVAQNVQKKRSSAIWDNALIVAVKFWYSHATSVKLEL
jgi:hypothetical protein